MSKTTKEDELFEHADWYSIGDDHEQLSHTEWSECLGQHFDDTAEIGIHHIKWQCAELGPLEIFAWKNKVLSKSFAEGMIGHLIEELQVADGWAENWWEDYGDFDGDHPPIDKKALSVDVDALAAELSTTLHNYLSKHTHIYQCDVSAKKEFSVDELEEFAKINYRGEWDKPVPRRGIDFDCEGCDARVGSTLDNGSYRCNKCGWPSNEWSEKQRKRREEWVEKQNKRREARDAEA